MAQQVILIGGPTASGKSALAMRLARQRNGCIINSDAMQIYGGLPLLTAQPEAVERAEIPHLLYEIMDAAEASSAGKWLALARVAIARVLEMGRTPVLVGGTGMYFQALLGGLADIPDVPDEVRAASERLYDERGEEAFRVRLAERDPASAARIARNDRQRLIRAYSVAMHTGKTLGEWQESGAANAPDYVYEKYLLMPPRDQLYEACNRRFAEMIGRGAVDEVKTLMARGLSPALPAMKILGVREIAAYLNGACSLDDAVKQAQQATRNYAKRQMTWFRNQWGSPQI